MRVEDPNLMMQKYTARRSYMSIGHQGLAQATIALGVYRLLGPGPDHQPADNVPRGAGRDAQTSSQSIPPRYKHVNFHQEPGDMPFRLTHLGIAHLPHSLL